MHGCTGVCQARCSAWGKFGGAPQDLPHARGGCVSGTALADHGNGVLIGISAPMLARRAAGVNRPGVSPPRPTRLAAPDRLAGEPRVDPGRVNTADR